MFIQTSESLNQDMCNLLQESAKHDKSSKDKHKSNNVDHHHHRNNGDATTNGNDYLHQQAQQHAHTQTPASMPASWQSLATPGSTVADYLSNLPASTLPLSLHHFLKYSAESIKKESEMAQAQTTTAVAAASTTTPNVMMSPNNKKKKKKKAPKEKKPRPKPGKNCDSSQSIIWNSSELSNQTNSSQLVSIIRWNSPNNSSGWFYALLLSRVSHGLSGTWASRAAFAWSHTGTTFCLWHLRCWTET